MVKDPDKNDICENLNETMVEDETLCDDVNHSPEEVEEELLTNDIVSSENDTSNGNEIIFDDSYEEINNEGDEQLFSNEEEIEDVVVEKDIRDLLTEDKDTFSYVSKYSNSFRIESIPVKDIDRIKNIIDSEIYIATIPSYIYDDIIFGYKEKLCGNVASYHIFSTEYSFTLEVPMKYRKDTNEDIRDYINRIITEYPIKSVSYSSYNDMISIEDYSVPFYGMLNISTTQGEYTVRLKDEFDFISFYGILLYFRNVVDQGIDVIKTGCIKEFFDIF